MFVVHGLSDAWIGVAGTAIGGVLGFLGTWLVQRSQRAATIAERSREERKTAYSALLTSAEESMHLFQWLAEGQVGPGGSEKDKAKANIFYDREVTPRLMALRIIGQDNVVEAGTELRYALNDVRHLVVDSETLPTDEDPRFTAAHERYRNARRTFIKLARADLP